jgi:hypothetical protein
MKKKISLLILLFFTPISCSDLVFVYDKKQIESPLQTATSWIINGDEKNILGVLLGKKIKSAKKATYILNVVSKKKETNIITEVNQVATKINLEFKIKYSLSFIKNNCLLYSDDITTEASYNAKSEGYSFGTDISKSKITEELIEENIDSFLNKVEISIFKNPNNTKLNCKTE